MYRQLGTAARALVAFTVLLGLAYPLLVTGVGRLPGLAGRADGSLLRNADGQVVGSRLIGQSYVDAAGRPLPRYFQSRPSAAGDGYDPTASAASNLGPEDIVDGPERTSLLTDVCARSRAVGELDGVDGRRSYCTPGGVGAVLSVLGDRAVSVNEWCDTTPTPFRAEYDGIPVACRTPADDVAAGRIVPIRGDAPTHPAVPADAVTASGSGLDPHISPAYAAVQVARVARARNLPADRVRELVARYTTGHTLGFLGEPAVNVLELNLALDRITG